MAAVSEFSVSYHRKDGGTGVVRIAWKKDDPVFFVCPDKNTEIAKAILTNLTQQWDASVLSELGLSNLRGKHIEDVAAALAARLPATDEFSFAGNELVEILKAL